MIFSDNRRPSLEYFQALMKRTDALLNERARGDEDYFIGRNGKPLEQDVFQATDECAKGTPFEGTIHLVSGAHFPDIVADDYYGIEVKSTKENHWKSTGSSILESTRISSVERIYLTFGKLGRPVEFMSRPYEEVMSEIAVTHYPRYRIDMQLEKGQTIFDKMEVSYDELRKMENPVPVVSRYYKDHLKPGETLWWASDDVEETVAPPTIRLWSALTKDEREELVTHAAVLFPELFDKTNHKKYERYTLWLASQKGVVNSNSRDGFSAGGQIQSVGADGRSLAFPAVFGRVRKYSDLIRSILQYENEDSLKEYWGTSHIESDRLKQWCRIIARNADSEAIPYEDAIAFLEDAFSI